MTPAAAGVDVGGTKILGVVVDGDGRVVAEEQVPTPATADELLDSIAEVVAALWRSQPGASLVGVGVGLPGLVDRTGRLRFAPNLPGIVEVDAAGELRRRFDEAGLTGPNGGADFAIVVDNDATCAGAAEFSFGAAKGTSDAVVVTLGTGIGGALFTEGAPLRGAHNFAGEIGHMVIDPSGPGCACGSRGCWEVFASGSALGRLGREATDRAEGSPGSGRMVELAGSSEAIRGEHVIAAATEGDDAACAVIDEYARWLAIGLANLANLLDPEVIVLAGGLVRAGDVLMEPTRRAFALVLEGAEHRAEIPVVVAVRGADAGAVGAAALVLAAAGH